MENDLYAQARVQANRDAADECAQKAQQVAKEDSARALRLLTKAAGLWPEKYGHVVAEQAFGGSPSAKPPADRRASQPYSFVPSTASRQESTGNASQTQDSRSHWEGAAGAAGGPRQHSYPPQQAGGSTSTGDTQAEAQHTYPSQSAWRRHAPQQSERQGQREQEGQKHQQQQQQQNSSSSSEGPGITASASGSWLDRKIDQTFKRLHQLSAARDKRLHYWLTYGLLLLLVGFTLASRPTPWLLGLLSKQAASRLGGIMQRSFTVVLLCALPTVATVVCTAYWLLPWAIWIASGMLWALLQPAKLLFKVVIPGIFWRPNIFIEGLLCPAWFWATHTLHPSLHRLWPAPILMYLAGGGWWCLLALGVFALLVYVSLATLQSTLTVAIGIACLQRMVWYKSMPAMLLLLVGWIVSVVHLHKDDDNKSRAGKGSARTQRPPHGSSNNSSRQREGADGHWWGQFGGGGKAKQKQPIPKGATGEVLRVLQSKDLFEVLELPNSCDDEAVRRAKRTKSLATHPDKLSGAPGAKEAFQLVTEAADALSDAHKRLQYSQRMQMEELATSRSAPSAPPSAAPAPKAARAQPSQARQHTQSATGAAACLDLPCVACGRSHLTHAVDINPACARFCNQCRTFHPARDGDAWIDKTGGFWAQKRVHTCLHGMIFDITAFATCNDLLYDAWGNEQPANTCKVTFRFTRDTGSQAKKSTKKNKRH